MSLYLLFHKEFCTSVNNCGIILFQRLKSDKLGRSKHLLFQIQQQDTIINSELCPKLLIKRVESRSGFFIVNLE